MAVTVLLIAVLVAIAGWWLAGQRLHAKPWLEEGPQGDVAGTGALAIPPSKLALGLFLAVVGSLFALFVSAYFMRMHMGDWRHLHPPRILWLNTAVLIASSVALHLAQRAARRGEVDRVRSGLLAGGVSAAFFLTGQLVAWRQLTAGGHLLATDPAAAFFYLITGMHGLHIVGGLVALTRTTARAWHPSQVSKLRLSIGLCATYWHFLLIVWLVLFNLLLLT